MSAVPLGLRVVGLHRIVACGLCLLCVALAVPAPAKVWYVDENAVGAGNGTNWANAWRNPTNIAWSSVAPGDTIYLSGGTYGTSSQPIRLAPAKGGASNAPITIKASQQPDHNGMVTIYGYVALGQNWITLDGARTDSYADTWITNTVNVPLITNNIGIRIVGDNAVNYYGSGPQGVRILWCEMTSRNDVSEAYGLRFNPPSNSDMHSTEIAYCWVHDVGQDALHMARGLRSTSWDDMVFHHNLVEATGDDGIEFTSGGLTVHHSIFRKTRHVRGHADAIQAGARCYRIYNNIFCDWTSSHIITQGVAPEGGDYGPIQVYGNLFFTDTFPCYATAFEWKWYPDAPSRVGTAYYRDFLFVNNTFASMGNGALTLAKRDYLLTNALVRASRIQNNIIWNSTNWSVSLKGAGAKDGFHYGEPDLVFDNNNVSGQGLRISYLGRSWANAEALNAGTRYKGNTFAIPSFEDSVRHDYRLKPTDAAARNQGADLSFLNLPGLERDMCGNIRGADGAWDMGAIETPPADEPRSRK